MKRVAPYLFLALLLLRCTGDGPGFSTESEVNAWDEKLVPGMSVDEVRQVVRLPYSASDRYPNLGESVLSWPYVEHGPRHMFFNAHFDAATGRLKRTSRTVDPAWISATP
jgi:hypothetical protein